jgi:hypothetical protein
MNRQAYQINQDQKLHLSALTSQNSFSDRQANKMCFRNSKHRPQQQEHTRPRQRFRLHHQMSSTIPNPVREHQTSQIFLKIRHKMRADINDCIVATRQHLEWDDGAVAGIQQTSHERTHFGPRKSQKKSETCCLVSR